MEPTTILLTSANAELVPVWDFGLGPLGFRALLQGRKKRGYANFA